MRVSEKRKVVYEREGKKQRERERERGICEGVQLVSNTKEKKGEKMRFV